MGLPVHHNGGESYATDGDEVDASEYYPNEWGGAGKGEENLLDIRVGIKYFLKNLSNLSELKLIIKI